MKRYFSRLAVALLALFATGEIAGAAECSASQRSFAEDYVRRGASEVMEAQGGGTGLRHEMNDCNYFSSLSRFRIRLEVHWRASSGSTTYYTVGNLRFDQDGSNRRYNEDFASASLETRRRSNSSLWNGSGRLNLPAQGRSRNTDVTIINNCGTDVRLAFRWRQTGGSWSSGTWRLTRDQRTYLRHSDERVRSSTRRYLLHVASGTGRTLVSGTHSRTIRGESFSMERREAASIPMTVRLCPS